MTPSRDCGKSLRIRSSRPAYGGRLTLGVRLQMHALRDFEIKAIGILADGVLSPAQFDAVSSATELSSYNHTGVGYFVSVAHHSLPVAPQTLSAPFVAGRIGETECGFVCFLGEGELTLECHPVSGPDVPTNMRDLPVQVSAEPSNVIDLR